MAFSEHHLVFTFGILGNIISVLVYLAPLSTFRRIYREKSTMGFQSIPYIVALFSSLLWIYNAILNINSILILSINSFGCAIESMYIFMYIYYAPNNVRFHTAKLLGLHIGASSTIVLFTSLLLHGPIRLTIVGWICIAFNLIMFAAPLNIMFEVVRTRSVEFMPLPLSCLLTVSVVVWFLYGLFKKDLVVAIPNALGFLLGLVQVITYMAFRNVQPTQAI